LRVRGRRVQPRGRLCVGRGRVRLWFSRQRVDARRPIATMLTLMLRMCEYPGRFWQFQDQIRSDLGKSMKMRMERHGTVGGCAGGGQQIVDIVTVAAVRVRGNLARLRRLPWGDSQQNSRRLPYEVYVCRLSVDRLNDGSFRVSKVTWCIGATHNSTLHSERDSALPSSARRNSNTGKRATLPATSALCGGRCVSWL